MYGNTEQWKNEAVYKLYEKMKYILCSVLAACHGIPHHVMLEKAGVLLLYLQICIRIWMHVCIHGWMDGWVAGWMDGLDGWMDMAASQNVKPRSIP